MLVLAAHSARPRRSSGPFPRRFCHASSGLESLHLFALHSAYAHIRTQPVFGTASSTHRPAAQWPYETRLSVCFESSRPAPVWSSQNVPRFIASETATPRGACAIMLRNADRPEALPAVLGQSQITLISPAA